MKQALVIDCCIRKELSRTSKLLSAFLSALPEEYEVKRLFLPEENLKYFSGDYFEERERLLEKGELSHPRFRYAHEFAEADLIVVAAPFWDLSFPALLKVYIEQVSVDGITFHSSQAGLQGLCRAENLVFLTTRGGCYSPGSGAEDMEMGSRYLAALQIFFGVDRYHLVAADGLDIEGADIEGILNEASKKAAELAAAL